MSWRPRRCASAWVSSVRRSTSQSTSDEGGKNTMSRSIGCGVVAALAALVVAMASTAVHAIEVNIGRQLGIGYLQLYVMQAQKLFEKHAKAQGVDDFEVNYHAIGSPAVLNDGLLSGKLDIAVAGPTSFLVRWDRTRGAGNPVKMVSGWSQQPGCLVDKTPPLRTPAASSPD